MTNYLKDKQCKLCNRYLPKDYEEEICPICKEIELFAKVRDFIRANTVNEYQVAEEFQIPLKTVKRWIKEGRIEYVLSAKDRTYIDLITCLDCGFPIKNGTNLICEKCEEKRKQLKTFVNPFLETDEQMRFLDNKIKK